MQNLSQLISEQQANASFTTSIYTGCIEAKIVYLVPDTPIINGFNDGSCYGQRGTRRKLSHGQ